MEGQGPSTFCYICLCPFPVENPPARHTSDRVCGDACASRSSRGTGRGPVFCRETRKRKSRFGGFRVSTPTYGLALHDLLTMSGLKIASQVPLAVVGEAPYKEFICCFVGGRISGPGASGQAVQTAKEVPPVRRQDLRFFDDRQNSRTSPHSSGHTAAGNPAPAVPNNAAHPAIVCAMERCGRMEHARRTQCPSACLSMPATRKKPGWSFSTVKKSRNLISRPPPSGRSKAISISPR